MHRTTEALAILFAALAVTALGTVTTHGQFRYPGAFVREADARILVTPKEAKVYVDGYYAGLVDDFDGLFQRLRVPPGEHEITLHLDGYRTVRQKVYLASRSTYKLHYAMEKLAAGETSEPVPPAAPPQAAGRPPQGMPPSGPPPGPGPRRGPRVSPERMPPGAPGDASSFGTLAVRVQPVDAEVLIDGEAWRGAEGQDRLIVEVAEGMHRVEIRKSGYQRFSADVQVRRGETTPLNVSLSRE